MKKGTHPEYGPVAFRDMTSGTVFVTRSTLAGTLKDARTPKTIEIGGVSYPLVDVDVTSESHPFWTGKQSTLDTEGRVEAFHRRYGQGTPGGKEAAR